MMGSDMTFTLPPGVIRSVEDTEGSGFRLHFAFYEFWLLRNAYCLIRASFVARLTLQSCVKNLFLIVDALLAIRTVL